MKKLISLLLCGVSLLAFELQTTKIANGAIAFLDLGDAKELKVSLADQEFPVLQDPKDPSKSYTLIPISYYEKFGTKQISLRYKQKREQLSFDVVDGAYEKEILQVQNSKVSLSKNDKERTAKEYAKAMQIYKTKTAKNYINSAFIMPLNSKITSDFGKARVYNGSLKGYHSGTDFRAEVGTEIIASNDGVVVLAEERFYAGGSVIIDHGQGIYTTYYHLSKFLVQEGDLVKKGQKIALSGESGRVTGPHLHFGVRVFGVQVDPLAFITVINKNLFKEER